MTDTPKPVRCTVRVTCDTGNHWLSTINTDFGGACAYYMDKTFFTEDFETGEETAHRVVSVEVVA